MRLRIPALCALAIASISLSCITHYPDESRVKHEAVNSNDPLKRAAAGAKSEAIEQSQREQFYDNESAKEIVKDATGVKKKEEERNDRR